MSEALSALPSPSPGPQQLSLGKQFFSIPGVDGTGRGILSLTVSLGSRGLFTGWLWAVVSPRVAEDKGAGEGGA